MPDPKRRWFQFLLGTLFLLSAVAVVAWVFWPRPNFPDPGKSIESVDILIDYGPVQLQIVNPKIIQASVAKPLNESGLEMLPSKYEIIGTIQVNYTDGSNDSALLFFPWGHWKHDDAYWTADLSLLKEECKALLQRSSHLEAKRLLDTQWLWEPAKR